MVIQKDKLNTLKCKLNNKVQNTDVKIYLNKTQNNGIYSFDLEENQLINIKLEDDFPYQCQKVLENDAEYCTECKGVYIAYNGLCKTEYQICSSFIVYCAECDIDTKICKTCVGGYNLINSECKKECVNDGETHRGMGISYCKPFAEWDPFCKENGFDPSGICANCIDKYYLDGYGNNAYCKSCTKNCLDCDSYYSCNKCDKGLKDMIGNGFPVMKYILII